MWMGRGRENGSAGHGGRENAARRPACSCWSENRAATPSPPGKLLGKCAVCAYWGISSMV
ncbi:MAG: hypothetical protein PUC45_04860 [Oscillospiraceae bacterium]|nr:hypothetical protein [Oscillospiraceae bacterium]